MTPDTKLSVFDGGDRWETTWADFAGANEDTPAIVEEARVALETEGVWADGEWLVEVTP